MPERRRKNGPVAERKARACTKSKRRGDPKGNPRRRRLAKQEWRRPKRGLKLESAARREAERKTQSNREELPINDNGRDREVRGTRSVHRGCAQAVKEATGMGAQGARNQQPPGLRHIEETNADGGRNPCRGAHKPRTNMKQGRNK
ncbi:hypothetical protein SUGI_0146630 [Cryptomeria japonica]|nr:hypothetical protein SUGI_0146630 [Cryptomeria japonica]